MLTDATRTQDFPSLSGETYLNTAAEGIPPGAVIDALGQYGRDKLLGMDGRAAHEAQWRAVREEAALALGLEAGDVGICSCSSEAFNLAALALRLTEADEVIITDLDFPAGATPWLQPTCPARVRVWKQREGALHLEDLAPLLSDRTRVVTVSLVSFYNGFRLDLEPLGRLIRERSAGMLLVDVTQALGRIPLELKDADLIISSTHKWILASHGGGIVGVPPHRAEAWTVPAGGWFHLANAFDADRFDRAVVKPGAASFMVGMPNYPAIYAVRAGLAYIREVGVTAIERHCRPLVEACLAGMLALPVEVISPRDTRQLAGILAFRHPKVAALHAHLHAERIHVMSQAGRLRVAIHGYNTMRDVERFLAELSRALKQVA